MVKKYIPLEERKTNISPNVCRKKSKSLCKHPECKWNNRIGCTLINRDYQTDEEETNDIKEVECRLNKKIDELTNIIKTHIKNTNEGKMNPKDIALEGMAKLLAFKKKRCSHKKHSKKCSRKYSKKYNKRR